MDLARWKVDSDNHITGRGSNLGGHWQPPGLLLGIYPDTGRTTPGHLAVAPATVLPVPSGLQ